MAPGGREEADWTRVGVAFPHRDGEGFSIEAPIPVTERSVERFLTNPDGEIRLVAEIVPTESKRPKPKNWPAFGYDGQIILGSPKQCLSISNFRICPCFVGYVYTA
jgi:hypothetical protein